MNKIASACGIYKSYWALSTAAVILLTLAISSGSFLLPEFRIWEAWKYAGTLSVYWISSALTNLFQLLFCTIDNRHLLYSIDSNMIFIYGCPIQTHRKQNVTFAADTFDAYNRVDKQWWFVLSTITLLLQSKHGIIKIVA